jgi:hypothetical protein
MSGYTTIEAMFDHEDRKREAYAAIPWYQKPFTGYFWFRLKWDTIHGIGECKFRCRVRINRALFGYDEFDWWEYYSNNSKRAVKLLTLLKTKGHSTPCDVTPERWNEILSDMIFFHEKAGNSNIWDLDAFNEEKHRYRRGKYYYHKYYEALWD